MEGNDCEPREGSGRKCGLDIFPLGWMVPRGPLRSLIVPGGLLWSLVQPNNLTSASAVSYLTYKYGRELGATHLLSLACVFYIWFGFNIVPKHSQQSSPLGGPSCCLCCRQTVHLKSVRPHHLARPCPCVLSCLVLCCWHALCTMQAPSLCGG